MMSLIGGCTTHHNSRIEDWYTEAKDAYQLGVTVPIGPSVPFLCKFHIHKYEKIATSSTKYSIIEDYLGYDYTHGRYCVRCGRIQLFHPQSVTWENLREIINERRNQESPIYQKYQTPNGDYMYS